MRAGINVNRHNNENPRIPDQLTGTPHKLLDLQTHMAVTQKKKVIQPHRAPTPLPYTVIPDNLASTLEENPAVQYL